MDSNNPSTESSYSDDEEQYGHGEGFDLPSPWEDRVFWENRNANQNHFYRTSSTFTSSSSTDADEEVKVTKAGKEDDVNDVESIGDDAEDYQIMVCRGKDGKYHVSTSTENMDDEVLAQFPSSNGNSNDIKQGLSSTSSSIFRPEMKSEINAKDAPLLALTSTNSTEWSEEDANECVESLEYSSSSGNVVSSLLSVVTIIVVATIVGYIIATNAAESTKLIKTAIRAVDPSTIEDYSPVSHQEQDTVAAAAVTEFEEYCTRGGLVNETFLGFLFHITHLIQNLSNLNIWKEKAESVLMGALPTNWAAW